MIINEITSNSVSSSVSDELRNKTKQFVLTNCSEALTVKPIWRGIMHDRDPIRHIDSRSSPLRKSANTNNYVHLFSANLPSWQQLPRRQVICTTDRMYASGYGQMYRVFPVNGTKIGVCPSMDFWELPYLRDKSDKNVDSLDSYIETTGYKILGRNPNNHDINAFLTDLRTMSVEWNNFFKNKPFAGAGSAVSGPESIITILTALLDPVKNKLQVQPISQLSATRKEVWFDGEAVLIAEKESWIMGFKEF